MGAAAVYARKSTDQAVCDEEKSVTRQVELAVACARTHGFEVPPEHIYVDDAISGAEFDRRPGLMRLLNTLRPQAPFAGLFMADKDRLGREQFETNHILKQISVAGVRIFEYQNGGQEVRLESPINSRLSAGMWPAAPSSVTATSPSSTRAVSARTSYARSARTRQLRSDTFSAWRPGAPGSGRSRGR